jgi:hypothetical protein
VEQDGLFVAGALPEPELFGCRYCPGDIYTSEARARARGWHIFRGLSQTGRQMYDVFCPDCFRRRKPQPQVSDGSDDAPPFLFDNVA